MPKGHSYSAQEDRDTADLSAAAIDNYQPVTYGKADIKLSKSSSDPSTCDATTEGSIYYDVVNHKFKGCDGSGTWKVLTLT